MIVNAEALMATAAVTSKGQITIPIEVREDLGLKAHDRIEFVKTEDGTYFIRPKKGSIMNLRGMFKGRGKTASVEEMDEAIAAHIQEDWARFERQRSE
jgi:AbrB family looped-hinge helix DNA binding protein